MYSVKNFSTYLALKNVGESYLKIAPFINWPDTSGEDPPLILICESLELFSTPFSSGVVATPAGFVFDGIDFVLFDCCLVVKDMCDNIKTNFPRHYMLV